MKQIYLFNLKKSDLRHVGKFLRYQLSYYSIILIFIINQSISITLAIKFFPKFHHLLIDLKFKNLQVLTKAILKFNCH